MLGWAVLGWAVCSVLSTAGLSDLNSGGLLLLLLVVARLPADRNARHAPQSCCDCEELRAVLSDAGTCQHVSKHVASL